MAFKRDEGFQGDSLYRQTMSGEIAAVILIASGPGSLAISDAEKTKILSECQTGFKFWTEQAARSGVSLTFVLFDGKATITASNCETYASCHDVFADPTLQAFGYASVEEVAQDCKNSARSDGAFVGFFSKYRQSHFAYAYLGGGPLYMQDSNDGWGSDQIDRVFAHEMGHVFNAPDEYTSCKCTELYGKGSCTAKNSNCKTFTSSQGAGIMDQNDLGHLYENTKKHVGWC